MEYSLQNLNQNAQLKTIKINEIINKLNLIGFEVDEIFSEQSQFNLFSDNIRILIKIPSNREDLLNEKLFLADLSTILVIELYKNWEKIKKNYSFILKQKYLEHYNYKSFTIQSSLSDVLIYNVEIKSFEVNFSPFWIQNKLKNLGIKPLKKVEDLLNLVTFEWGQSFSFLPLKKSSELCLKRLTEKKIFQKNKDIFYELKEGTLVITNKKEEILTFLGLFDIDYSKKNEDQITIQSIFYDIHQNNLEINPLESKLPLRYLRKIFLENFKFSFQRLLTLLELSYSVKIVPTIYSLIHDSIKIKSNNILKFKKDSLKKFLNIENYDPSIFEKAGLKIICKTKSTLYFQIPSFRNDLLREIDLIEEYSRFIGYKNFEEISPFKTLTYSLKNRENINFIKQFFLNYGFNEIITNPIQDIALKKSSSVLITNPLTNELGLLRIELISKLIETFETNSRLTFQYKNFFEIGRVFHKKNKKIQEVDKLGGIFQIEKVKKTNSPNLEWFIAKGFLENFIANFGYNLSNISIEKNSSNFKSFHETKSILIKYNNKVLGIFGEINPKIEKTFNSKFATYIFELDLSYFEKWRMNSSIKTYKEFSKYPLIIKDLSFSIKKSENISSLKKDIENYSSNIKSIKIFDIYFDEKIIDSINLGIRFEFQSNKKTLLNEEIELEMKLICEFLNSKFNAKFKK